jgi:hypothetical protein
VLLKLSKLLLILTLSVSIGLHWAALQSAAWMGMIIKYSHNGTFSEAIEKTFDGKHPCSLCKQIAKGKQSERKAESQIELKKLEFFDNTVSFVFSSPQAFRLIPERAEEPLLRANVPPVPPPRNLLG